MSIEPLIDVPQALAMNGSDAVCNSEKSRFIRRGFDAIFYYFVQAQICLNEQHFLPKDVIEPTTYYVNQLVRYRK
jgi:hypothetical protein